MGEDEEEDCWSWRARAVVEWVVVARKRKRDVRGFLRMGDMVILFFWFLIWLPYLVRYVGSRVEHRRTELHVSIAVKRFSQHEGMSSSSMYIIHSFMQVQQNLI